MTPISESRSRQILRRRVLRAGLWTSGLHAATRGAGFVRNVLLARVLSPDDFGLFGIALVVISIIERFSNTGLQAALIQSHRAVHAYLDSAWTIQLLRGVLLCVSLMLTASPVAALLGDARAAPLVAMLGLAVLLRSLQNPGMLLYRRDLETRYQFVHRSGGTLVELLTSIGLAFVLRSAWALTLGLVVGRAALLLLSYTLHPYRPRVRLQFDQLRELSHFGRWVFLDNMLLFLAYRGDNLIVGKFFGAPALGVYMLAFSISEVVALEIGRVTREIAFPAYSRIQSDLSSVQRAFTMSLDAVASVACPLAAVLAFMAGPLTHVVFGPRWEGVATVLPPLAFAAGLRAIIGHGTVAFAALGQPALAFRTNLVAVAATYLVMLPLVVTWGLNGVAITVAVGPLIALVPFTVFVRRVLGISATHVARQLLPGCALVAIVGATTAGANELFREYSMLRLTAAIALILFIYGTASAVLWVKIKRGPVSVLEFIRSARRVSVRTAISAHSGS